MLDQLAHYDKNQTYSKAVDKINIQSLFLLFKNTIFRIKYRHITSLFGQWYSFTDIKHFLVYTYICIYIQYICIHE